jgi:phage terminase small subunit
MKGRKPVPRHLKLLRGNPGKRSLNKNEPMPLGDLVDPPEWLTASQKAGWNYAVENAPRGLLKKLDQSVVAVWVVAEDLHRQATTMVARFGLLTKTPKTGQPMQSPYLPVLNTPQQEIKTVSHSLAERTKEGIVPHEIGDFVPSTAELDRARAAVGDAKLPYKVLDDNVEATSGRASIGTMHLAKGLEFRTVVVMACDDEVIPLQQRIETVADDADLEEVYNTERHLLYVARTRARDHLLVTSVDPASEFLDDLRQ